MLAAGALDRRITIEKPIRESSQFGTKVAGWETVATVWASVKEQVGDEQEKSGSVFAELRASFQIRYLGEVDTTCRVTYNGRVYDIFSVLEIGKRDGLQLDTKSRQGVK